MLKGGVRQSETRVLSVMFVQEVLRACEVTLEIGKLPHPQNSMTLSAGQDLKYSCCPKIEDLQFSADGNLHCVSRCQEDVKSWYDFAF